MKRIRIYGVLIIVLLVFTSGLVMAQDATVEPAGEAIAPCTPTDPLGCRANAASDATGETFVPQTVVYGEVEGVELILDVYQPATSAVPLPAVILIHGGAGSFADRSVEADRAQGLAANGYVAFNIDYRLLDGGNHPWPAQLEDSQFAVRWIRANAAEYNVDPDRICSLGHSFGGQLAGLLGVRDTAPDSDLPLGEYSSKVACVVAIAAGLDATRPYLDEAVEAQMTLYGGAPSQTMPARLDASPLAQVSTDSAPFLLFHGADDENTPVEQSRNMADALHRAGVAVVYVEYPHATHFYWISFFEITGSWDTVAPETLAFLDRHLAAPAS